MMTQLEDAAAMTSEYLLRPLRGHAEASAQLRKQRTERFESKYIPEPNSGCWLWLAALSSAGYPVIWDGEKVVYAHRYSYELFVEKIADGLHIDHLCRVPCCVNPDHMEPVTPSENCARGIGPSAVNKHKTHCIRGHSLSGSNLYWRLDRRQPGRVCRTCQLIRNQKENHMPKVRCAVCGKIIVGRIPKGGDGSVLWPHYHKNWSGKPCEGRFMDGELDAQANVVDLTQERAFRHVLKIVKGEK